MAESEFLSDAEVIEWKRHVREEQERLRARKVEVNALMSPLRLEDQQLTKRLGHLNDLWLALVGLYPEPLTPEESMTRYTAKGNS